MKVYTDRPGNFNNVVHDSSQADVVIVYSVEFLSSLENVNVPVYFVGRRMPLSAPHEISIRLISESGIPSVLDGHSLVQATPVRPAVLQPAKKPARTLLEKLYVSYSPGTDVGKTFMAANLSCWRAVQGNKVVLMDLDTTISATWEMLHMDKSPQATISSWTGSPVQEFVAGSEHPAISGLYVLPHGGVATPVHVIRMIEAFCDAGYEVVADMSNNIDLPHISSVLMIGGTVMLIGRLRDKLLYRMHQMLVNAHIVNGRLLLIVNRVGARDDDRGLTPEGIARQFPVDRWYVVHENVAARNTAKKKKTFPIMVKSRVKKELESIFEFEFPSSSPQVNNVLFSHNERTCSKYNFLTKIFRR